MTINVGRLYRDKREEVYSACDGTYEEGFENAARELEELRETNGVEGEIVQTSEATESQTETKAQLLSLMSKK